MKNKYSIPVFVSVVAMSLGFYDLVRGFMHTVMLGYSAAHFAGLDLTIVQAADLLRLLGLFGVSNFITGVMLILSAWLSRPLALAMLGVIPAAYGIGYLTIHHCLSMHPQSTAKWSGMTPFLVYLLVCVISFIAGIVVMWRRSRV